MKLYKVKDVVEVLTECQQIGIDGYCGFGFDDDGHLQIILKDHEAGYYPGEAVEEVTLLEDYGEY